MTIEAIGCSHATSPAEQMQVQEMARTITAAWCFDPPPDVVPEEYIGHRKTAIAFIGDFWAEQGIAASVIQQAVAIGTANYNERRN